MTIYQVSNSILSPNSTYLFTINSNAFIASILKIRILLSQFFLNTYKISIIIEFSLVYHHNNTFKLSLLPNLVGRREPAEAGRRAPGRRRRPPRPRPRPPRPGRPARWPEGARHPGARARSRWSRSAARRSGADHTWQRSSQIKI